VRIKKEYCHKRLPDFEAIDEVKMAVVPRYKRSGLSGDEWRQKFYAELFFKGLLLETITAHRLEDISLRILSIGMGHTEDGCIGGSNDAAKLILKKERECCDQPSCKREPVHFYVLKEEFSSCGEGPMKKEVSWRYFRQFCSGHSERGDCGCEDADRNYSKVHRSKIYEEDA
jgi:hypothetical protein